MAELNCEQRSKRQRIDKTGRFAALQKLKDLKGQKNKCSVQESVDNVYDIVDESEFAKRSREKYGNDWIEEDGTGYIEDGRDIFEDDEYYSGDEEKSTNETKKKGKKRAREEDKPTKGKSSIKNLFKNAVVKKKKEDVNLAEDDILADVLGGLDSESDKLATTAKDAKESSRVVEKKEVAAVKEYVQNFMNSIKKREGKAGTVGPSDDEIIEKVLKPQNRKRDSCSLPTIQENEVLDAQPVERSNLAATVSLESDKLSSEKSESTELNECDQMDYSILDDDENPFDQGKEEEKKSSPTPRRYETEADLKSILDLCSEDCFDDEMTLDAIDDTPLSKDVMKMWLWDAWEDPKNRPGQIFLFGKVGNEKQSKSICVHVTNVDHRMFLLPRAYILNLKTNESTKKPVTFSDINEEFKEVTSTLGVKEFRMKPQTKHFAFQTTNLHVPATTKYVEFLYNGKYPTPSIKKRYRTVEHIFGTNTSSLETVLLQCKIKGPCWLNIHNVVESNSPLSWCKLEVTCNDIKNIKVSDEQNDPPPPLSVLAVNVRTALNSKTNRNEVVLISGLVNNRFFVDKPPPAKPFHQHFCGVTRPQTIVWPLDVNQKLNEAKSMKFDTERALLSWFLASYQKIDPDLIVTHDAYDCQLDVLGDRISHLKIPMWSRLGRLKKSLVPQKTKKIQDFFTGRLICDVKKSAEELLMKSRSYDLGTLCVNVLNTSDDHHVDVSDEELYFMYESGQGIARLATLTMQDCLDVLRIMCELNVIPLALQITQVCGNLMSHTLLGGRSERNEYLLLHAFIEKDYIVPDKRQRESNWEQDGDASTTQVNQTRAGRKKPQYAGGLVLEPIKGFYDKLILLMDFNSLYPSIIQEYNICFTTVEAPEKEGDPIVVPESDKELGILPRQIRRLVESRREVKKLMANPDLDKDTKAQYGIRQLALKLTANSMYGCLGFSQSRFFAQHLASLVTEKGRDILTNTKSLVQKLSYEVIYGDTDSLMINTNIIDYDQVFKIGHSIKQNVNRIYKQIELDIDGVFKYLLLLKKKKYAALVMEKNRKGEIVLKQEHKGLDIVRRDWSGIAVLAGKKVIDEIFSDNQLDEKIENIHKSLEKFRDDIVNGMVPLSLLEITKQLTKAPKDYTSAASFPHVQVALRMNQTRNKRYKKGDMVSYIICEDGTNNAPMQRAYHLDEVKTDEKLKVDTTYYLAQQIHPVVFRICEPLEGTDASRIAISLGLDPNKYRAAAQRVHRERMEEGEGVAIAKSIAQKYRQCENFKFTCSSCKTENTVASAFKPINSGYVAVLEKCSNAECSMAPYQYAVAIRNELILTMRKCIRRFYDNWMVCDDPSCNNNTRIYSHVTKSNKIVCHACKQGSLVKQYSEKDLFTQLDYFTYIFDLSKHESKNITVSIEVEAAYNLLKETVEQQLQNSAYCKVDLSKFFANFFIAKSANVKP